MTAIEMGKSTTKSPTDLPPLLVAWLKDRHQFTDTVTKAAHRGGHRTLWHLLRSPIYLVRLVAYSPRGAWRVLRQLWRFMSDEELRPLRIEAVTGSDPATALKLRKERNERIHRRLVVAAVLATILLVALVAIWFFVPGWTVNVASVGAVLILGWIGRPIGKPIAPTASTIAGNPGPLRAPFVMEALVSLGIPRMTKVDGISLLMDVARVGPGYQVDLELPAGVPASAVQEKRSELSAAMRRELGCVWPSVGKRHEGHLSLYVCDQPMTSSRQAPWPLLKDGAVNVFRPAPMFTNQRGEWVDLTLAYTSGVIGAVPRMGKTFAVRELLLVAGLDVRTKIYAVDLKGTGDLAPTALFSHFYGVGDEDEEIEEQLTAMQDLRVEMRRRAKVIRGLSHEECPENKVTDALANRRELGLEPIFVAVDECQIWFEHADKKIREELTAICTDLVKRGPALGIMCYFATQKPSAKSIPTDIADNAIVRLCFKVGGQVANDQVLGTSSYKEGVRATHFAFTDKGVGILKGDGSDPQIVRTVAGLDAPTSEKVAARARALRAAAGRLTGHATGEVMQEEAVQVELVEDVRFVFDRRPAMHFTEIREALALLRPGLYSHLDNDALGAMLRTAGVQTGSVYVSQLGSHKGVKAEWLAVSTTAVIGGGDPGEGNVRPIRPGQSLTAESEGQSGS